MPSVRRSVFQKLALSGLALLPFLPLAAHAVDADTGHAPTAPLTLIVPFPENGATDVVARIIARQASVELGEPIQVQNTPGAGGTLGVAQAAAAPRDGRTLLLTTTSTHAVSPHLFQSFSYNVKKDFVPIAHLGTAGSVVLVSPQLPVRTLQELIDYSKASPGKLSYGSSGGGTIVHLMTEALATQAGIRLSHMTYRGTGAARKDLISGRLHLLVDAIPTGAPHVHSGELKALAVTTRERSSLLPDIPTLDEAGLPGLEFTTWFGLYAPSGLPADQLARFHHAFTRAIQDSGTALRLSEVGVAPPDSHTPAEFAAMVEADSRRWKEVIDATGVSAH